MFLDAGRWHVVTWVSNIETPSRMAYESFSTCVEWPDNIIMERDTSIRHHKTWADFISFHLYQAKDKQDLPLGLRYQECERFRPKFCLLPWNTSSPPEILYQDPDDGAKQYMRDRKRYCFRSTMKRIAEIPRYRNLLPFEGLNVVTNIAPSQMYIYDAASYFRLIEPPECMRWPVSVAMKKHKVLIEAIISFRGYDKLKGVAAPQTAATEQEEEKKQSDVDEDVDDDGLDC